MNESKTPKTDEAQAVSDPANAEEALQRAKDAMMYWCDRYDQAASDLAVALAERDALAARVAEYRHVLIDVRCSLHAAGRRPETCHEMSTIDAAMPRKEKS